MNEKAKSSVMACFVADSLALGVHWIYDTEVIARTYGRVDALMKPAPNSFHPTKEKGTFTHYGDQMMVLLESLADMRGFDLNDFSARWQALFANYDGYIDQATRGTLDRYRQGRSTEEGGSASDDLAGASRMAPLVYGYRNDLEKLVDAARAQTRMTHNNPITIDSSEFFARVAWLSFQEMPPHEAMERVCEKHFRDTVISHWVAEGLKSKGKDSVSVISQFGQSCHAPSALPGVVHLIATYEDDLKEALIQSAMAGGDGAARGMMAGMVLGAYLGPESLPEQWISGLKKRDRILQLIEEIP
jgi:ADP-ribosylglycohydrolase